AESAQRSGEIIEKTIANVSKGVELVAVTTGAFGEVAHRIQNGGDAVAQIATSSNEQALGIEHIAKAIAKIEAVTQNNVANASETAEAAEAVTTQTEATRTHLEELVSMVGLQRG